MTRFALVAALLALAVAPARAQEVPADPPPADPVPADPGTGDPDRIPGLSDTSVGIIPAGLVAPVGVVSGDGIRIGEGTVLHPAVGADTGYVSNVFYDDTSTAGAGIFRVIGQIGTSSLSAARLAPRGSEGGAYNAGSFQHSEDLRLSYDFYLSGNDYVSQQNGLGIDLTLRGTVFPGRTWSFLYLDTFSRMVRATNFESADRISRDINRLYLGLQWAPVGRSVKGLIHYENTLDLFESSAHKFADRLQNTAGVTAAWRVRPVTQLFADASMAFNFGIGSAVTGANKKVDSYPLTIAAGVQTLLSLKTTFVARLGYTNGFYSSGPSYSTIMGGVQLGYRYSPLGRATLMYQYDHADSINANWYRDHMIQLRVDQGFVPFGVSVTPELRLRHYAGIMTLIPTAPDNRDDLIFAVTAAARYNFRNSLAAVLQYRFTALQTDYRYTVDMNTDDPSYARHELVAGFRAGW